MGYLDPYVLPEDTRITALSGLRSPGLEEIGAGADDFVVTRPWSRLPSSVVDARTAALLERFRQPTTIVDAVVELSAAERLDPRAILDDAARMVRRLVEEGVLAPAGSLLADPILAEVSPGDRLGGIEVVEPVQVFVDVEVHRGRTADGADVAIKLARAAARASAVAGLTHERRVLERLGGDVAPALVAYGDRDGRPWIATRWCAGIDVASAAATAQATDAVLRLAEAVLEAYSRLHAHGVVHGDVHPRNVVVDEAGAVTILDLGASVLDGVRADDRGGGRAGVDLFAEPEVAEAALAGAPLPPPTPLGEQYAVGVLLFVLLVGDHPYGSTADPRELLRRVLDPPTSVEDRLSVTGGVGRVVRRALQARPEDRHASIADMLAAFRAALAAHPAGVGRVGSAAGSTGPGRLTADVLDRLASKDARFEQPPTGDPMVMHGLAGRAWALLRCAEAREDPELLAVADLWATLAAAAADTSESKPSLLHGAAGVHAVRLAVARARCDPSDQHAAVAAFVDAASAPSAGADVTHGRAGLLLGCCAMLAAAQPEQRRPLTVLGARLADDLDAGVEVPYGVAHGAAGRLLALLRWVEVTRTAPHERLAARLDDLARTVAGAGRPQRRHPLVASWCNGAAGLVHVWIAAHRVLGDDRWDRLARQAGTSVELVPNTPTGDLCCGLGGQAYALLALHRATGEARWLGSSRRLAEAAAHAVRRVHPDVRDSLYAGQPGVAALAADLAVPAEARMPLVDPL